MAGLDPAIQTLQLARMIGQPGWMAGSVAGHGDGGVGQFPRSTLPLSSSMAGLDPAIQTLQLARMAFTHRYEVKVLVWFERYDLVIDAIQRETSLKRWPRKWKLELIERMNPEWADLYETLNA